MRQGNNQTTEEGLEKRISMKTSKFEYIGRAGKNSEDGVYLICKDCGALVKRNGQFVRKDKQLRCTNCNQILQKRRDAFAEKERLSRKVDRENERILRENERSVQLEIKYCKTCGGMFFGKGRYCSKRCQNHKPSSFWKVKDAYRYAVPLPDLYDRDNGVCYLCGGKCDWNDYSEKDGVVIYGNMYPSRDHVIPKSKGGANDWSNIRLAHRICNTMKGVKAV